MVWSALLVWQLFFLQADTADLQRKEHLYSSGWFLVLIKVFLKQTNKSQHQTTSKQTSKKNPEQKREIIRKTGLLLIFRCENGHSSSLACWNGIFQGVCFVWRFLPIGSNIFKKFPVTHCWQCLQAVPVLCFSQAANTVSSPLTSCKLNFRQRVILLTEKGRVDHWEFFF